ncbi:MAG TPA: DUF4129 domain-containing protein [Gaiellaceae bacterium]|nr:DUF4129 domain-containing protein [Gaiellaceae bacterium]
MARRPLAGGSGEGRDVSPVFLDYALSTALALYLVWVPIALYLFWSRGGWRRDPHAGRRRDVAILVAVGVLLVLALTARGLRDVPRNDAPPTPTLPTASIPTTGGAADAQRPERRIRLAPFLVVGAALGLGIAYLAYRRNRLRRPPAEGDEQALAEELELLLDDAIGDLLAEPDPRRAVIAAYARMERALAAFGLPRAGAEAPLEYLARIAPQLPQVPGAARLAFELTHLYERARFSAHEVDVAMKEDAIRALRALRAELSEWAA